MVSKENEVRKIQFTGRSTYILSLPKKWMNEMHLKPGDPVTIIREANNSYKAAADTLRGLRPDGRLMFIGASDEPFTIPSPGEFLMNRHQIIGSNQNGREYLYEALDYVAKGKVKVMAETFPLDDVADAYEKVANGKVRFRAVINA